jgi:DNA-binding response OmpR family regulator
MLPKSNHTLLYVEDEAFTRDIAVRYLRPYFKEIYQAQDGLEALEIYQELQPDIIITDIHMPKLNGLELCKRIRIENLFTPIIITTAYTDTNYLLEAVSLNLIKYLVKPIEEKALEESLTICLERLTDKQSSTVCITKEHIFDIFNHTIVQGEKVTKLTDSQYKLLTILLKNHGRIVSYEELQHYIWFDKVMSHDALRSLVRDVRKLIGKEQIQNISKFGYRLHIDG